MKWLIGQTSALGYVAAKAALTYVTALVALRLGERRTLAQWTMGRLSLLGARATTVHGGHDRPSHGSRSRARRRPG